MAILQRTCFFICRILSYVALYVLQCYPLAFQYIAIKAIFYHFFAFLLTYQMYK